MPKPLGPAALEPHWPGDEVEPIPRCVVWLAEGADTGASAPEPLRRSRPTRLDQGDLAPFPGGSGVLEEGDRRVL